jgi:hypothetical protein
MKSAVSAELILHGPQHSGEGVSQNDIDALLGDSPGRHRQVVRLIIAGHRIEKGRSFGRPFCCSIRNYARGKTSLLLG